MPGIFKDYKLAWRCIHLFMSEINIQTLTSYSLSSYLKYSRYTIGEKWKVYFTSKEQENLLPYLDGRKLALW